MELSLERLFSNGDSTIGVAFVDGRAECFTCEDEFRAVKVRAETRVPAGRYELKLRAEGPMHERYKARFGEFHAGMLWLQDVPGFEYVYIHIGNQDDDTEGCILVGRSATLGETGGGIVGYSGGAYRRLYESVRDELLAGRRVWITIMDRDRP